MRSMKRDVHREGCVSQNFSRVLVIEIESSLFTQPRVLLTLCMCPPRTARVMSGNVFTRGLHRLYSSRSLARLLQSDV